MGKVAANRHSQSSCASVADDALLAEVAAKLQRIEGKSGWERTREIGQLLLLSFFGGSVETWREKGRGRGRGKDHSLRRLATHASCPLEKSSLAEAIGVFVFGRENPEVLLLEHITPGHVAKVLGCEASLGLQLLRVAHEQRLSVKTLAERISGLCEGRSQRLYTRTAGGVTLGLQRIERRLEALAEPLSNPNVLASLDKEKIRALVGNIRRLLDVVETASGGVPLQVPRRSEIRALRSVAGGASPWFGRSGLGSALSLAPK